MKKNNFINHNFLRFLIFLSNITIYIHASQPPVAVNAKKRPALLWGLNNIHYRMEPSVHDTQQNISLDTQNKEKPVRDPLGFYFSNKYNNTFLHIACKSGDIPAITLLCQRYPEMCSAQNIRGNTPLHIACQKKNIDAVKIILGIKIINPNLANHKGKTALHIVCENDCSDITKLLYDDLRVLNTAKNYNSFFSGETPIHTACKHGSLNSLNIFLEDVNYPINVVNVHDQTPLHLACLFGHVTIVKRLLNVYGTNINWRDFNNSTPLHNAVEVGNSEIVTLFINTHRTDLSVIDEEGFTPLDIAYLHNNLHIVKLLRENRAKTAKEIRPFVFCPTAPTFSAKMFSYNNAPFKNIYSYK